MKKIAAFALVLFLLKPSPVFATSSFDVIASDTVAGLGTQIRTSRLSALQDVTFVLVKPDSSILRLNSVSGQDGIALLQVDDYHLRRAGTYTVSGESGGVTSEKAVFTVFPAELSASQSLVNVDRSLVSTRNNDSAIVTATLTDAFSNPLANHEVRLISSRPEDRIELRTKRDFTDSNGSVIFLVSSSTPGVSSISAYDVTQGVVLEKRVRLAFLNDRYFSDSGGDDFAFFSRAYAQAPTVGPLDHFEFGDFPTVIDLNKDISFSVKALDAQNNVATNYLGTIHFSAVGENSAYVKLPEDYTFTPEDTGKHVFPLGLSFTKSEIFKLEVRDLKNPDIVGTTEVTVGKGEAPALTAEITIKSPTAGTYSINIQTISGTTLPGIDVKIYDNNEEIGLVTADAKGDFSYMTAPLSDGSHKIFVSIVDNKGKVLGKSEEVALTIDTQPPAVEQLEFTPKEASPSSVVQVKLFSEPNLVKASLLLGSTIIDLEPDIENPGVYEGSLQAPPKSGEYPVDIVLKDQLGNEQSYKNQSTLKVSETLAPPLGISTPSVVTGVNAFPGDSRVTLTWDAATDDTGIKHYRVYYGTSADALINVADTFDNSTTWYVPNLQSGKEYFFGITAVDLDLNESSGGSEVVSAIPAGAAGGPIAPSPFAPFGLVPAAPTTFVTTPQVFGGTGPEMSVSVLLSSLGVLSYFSLRKVVRKRVQK